VEEMHIGAFKGKDAKNNRLIIEALALNGSFVKYDIYKIVKKQRKIAWSTVSRRVDALRKAGYIKVTGTRRTVVGNREEDSPTYGITWRGLIASVEKSEVRGDMLTVLQKNPHLELPEPFLTIIGKLFTEEEINEMALKLAEAILILPLDLESLKDEKEVLWHVMPLLNQVGFKVPEKKWNPELIQMISSYILDYEKKLVSSLEKIRLLKKQLGIDDERKV